MTPEEACAYLDISMDDELSITLLERNYGAKISKFKDSPERRAKIEEAYSILLGLYRELYESPDQTEKQNLNQKHESMFMKIAVLLSAVFVLCFAGVVMFVYVIHKENASPRRDTELDRNYERVLHELDSIRRKQEETQKEKLTPEELLDKIQRGQIETPQSIVNNPPADYVALVEHVMPSIVFIQTNKGTGSGFFVSPNGDILTNHHVIDGAEYIIVTTQDGQRYNALLKDYNSQKDMALIKINLQYNSPFLKISNLLPRQGENVIAIGNPRKLGWSVSNGIVSGIREVYNNLWVQFTAPVSKSSSGGALLNINGEVVGMVTRLWEEEGQNLNLAVASTVLNQFLSSAINKPAGEIIQPKKPNTASRTQPRQTPNTPKESKGSGIPLPTAKGFLVHKWGCSVESVRRYVSSPLQETNLEGFYSTFKKFKAFKVKVETLVFYHFWNDKLYAVTFITNPQKNLEASITKELTERYHTKPESKYATYDKIGTVIERTWRTPGLIIELTRNVKVEAVCVKFSCN